MTSFKIVSYNMHGFYNGIDFVNEILNNVDCVCVQELWQREQSLLYLIILILILLLFLTLL